MKLSPTRILEEQLTQHGFLRIAGVDEAGCGALAGPVVAGAVILGDDPLTGLRESKLMKEDERESLFDHLIGHVQAWGVGVVNAREIETIGIRPATYLAMRRAIEQVGPDHLLVDAWTIPETPITQRGIIRGDRQVLSIAAGALVAKVSRDRMMRELDESYPNYGFKTHKGYGTATHRSAIKTHGPCLLHRMNFTL